jgi:ABC-2 type transport system permease protein
MTVYKYFIKVALKNRGIILMYIGVFFAISLLFGFSATEREAGFIASSLNIGIIDHGNGELSAALVDYLKEKNNLVDIIDDEEYIKEQIFLEVVDAAIVIPEDFDQKVINKEEALLVYKDARKQQSIQLQNQVNKFLVFANATYENGMFNLGDVNRALAAETEVELVKCESSTVNQAASQWFGNYFNFAGYVTIAIYIAVIGLVMADFKDSKIKNRMKISAKKFFQLNKEIYTGQLTLALLITLVFISGSILFKGNYIAEVNFSKYVINLLVFSFSILCVTFLINNLSRNKFVINALATVLSLGTSLISGVMVPQEILGDKVLAIAKFFPVYYFVKANDMSINSILDIRYELIMQLLFAVAFLLIGLYFSKRAQKV